MSELYNAKEQTYNFLYYKCQPADDAQDQRAVSFDISQNTETIANIINVVLLPENSQWCCFCTKKHGMHCPVIVLLQQNFLFSFLVYICVSGVPVIALVLDVTFSFCQMST